MTDKKNRPYDLSLTYQQGTVVLSCLPPRLRPDRVAGLAWDGRVDRYRVPAYRYPDLIRLLAAHRLRVDDRVREWADLDPPNLLPQPLRGYQTDAIETWEASGKRGMVALPTGTGKTRVALSAISRSNVASLVLVPTRALMAQWKATVEEMQDRSAGQVGDGVFDLQPVTICTFESSFRHLQRFGQRFGMLVVDEAHHFASGMRAEGLEMSPAPYRLGLSATPPSDPEGAARLGELIGPVVFGLSVADLSGPYLAPFDTVVLPVRLSAQEELDFQRNQALFMSAFRKFKAGRPRGNWPEFIEWARSERAGLRAIAAWHRSRAILSYPAHKRQLLNELLDRHRQRKVLVFVRDNDAAYEISRNHLIPAVTCDIKRKERTQILGDFRTGKTRALVSARVLNEGLDLPDADIAIIVGSSGSTREFVQRAGRVLRPRPGKRATVYELVVRETAESRTSRRHVLALDGPGPRSQSNNQVARGRNDAS